MGSGRVLLVKGSGRVFQVAADKDVSWEGGAEAAYRRKSIGGKRAQTLSENQRVG